VRAVKVAKNSAVYWSWEYNSLKPQTPKRSKCHSPPFNDKFWVVSLEINYIDL
jgi:hypothetical protein